MDPLHRKGASLWNQSQILKAGSSCSRGTSTRSGFAERKYKYAEKLFDPNRNEGSHCIFVSFLILSPFMGFPLAL
jgi:hypothetical protein